LNDKFFELSEEKRQRIINAGFEVFSENEYKRASTDTIAERAGISKGLLFYYFHNKKEFYLYLFDYAAGLVKKSVLDKRFAEIRDYFELFRYSMHKKYELLEKNHGAISFLTRAYYTQNEEVSEGLVARINEMTDMVSMKDYLANIDMSKFRDEIDPVEIMQMLSWSTEGFLQEQKRRNKFPDFKEAMARYDRWSQILRKVAYREEYQ
jgi:AcrR family transcriptional regulator